MKKIITLLIFLTWFSTCATAQDTTNKSELKVGDKIPDIKLENIYGASTKLISLSDGYKKGLLIINFWASWCVPCIREMEVLSKLSKKNVSSGLSIISITHEKQEISQAFFKKHPEIDISGITVLNQDKLFQGLFPHRVIPHNIWIDSTGTIVAITGTEEITEERIMDFVNKKNTKLKTKVDVMNFDYANPYQSPDSSSIFRSSLSKFRPGLPAGSLFWPPTQENPSTRVFVWNCTLSQIYWSAFSRELKSSDARNSNLIEIHSKDSLKIMLPKDISKTPFKTKVEWGITNSYIYELCYSRPIAEKDFFAIMREDLIKNFGYEGVLEKRKRNSVVFNWDKQLSRPQKSIGGKQKFELSAEGVKVTNMTVPEIFVKLNLYLPNLHPMFNETGIDYPIDLQLQNPNPQAGLNFDKVIKLLSEKGFIITNEDRKTKVLIIRDWKQ